MRTTRSSTSQPGGRLLRLLVLAVGTVAVVVVALFRLGQPSVVAAGGGCTAHTSCTRVLFLGDSLTFVNDLPTTFADLAWAGGHHVDAQTLSSGGETLAGHVADPNTATTIASTRWNTVVLQDQSENPSLPYYRQNEMFPAATQLVAMIRDDGAQPLLFLTWAHQNGWPQADLDDYASMQAAVDQGYLDLATTLDVPVTPVGDAWRKVVSASANADLWQGDGVHPTVAGTYLAACVFYASIFKQSPVGLSYRSGLSSSEVARLQHAAASTVFTDPSQWGAHP